GPTATGLAAGNYTVTITDAFACQITRNFTITEPAALTASAGTVMHATGHGLSDGSAEVIAAGGTPGYTYSWNTVPVQTGATATGLGAGTYTVTVTDANGCSTTRDFTITEPGQLVAVVSAQTNVLCHGTATGEATVS